MEEYRKFIVIAILGLFVVSVFYLGIGDIMSNPSYTTNMDSNETAYFQGVTDSYEDISNSARGVQGMTSDVKSSDLSPIAGGFMAVLTLPFTLMKAVNNFVDSTWKVLGVPQEIGTFIITLIIALVGWLVLKMFFEKGNA